MSYTKIDEISVYDRDNKHLFEDRSSKYMFIRYFNNTIKLIRRDNGRYHINIFPIKNISNLFYIESKDQVQP